MSSPDRPIEGIVAYPITPFRGDGLVDLPRLTQLVDRLVESGVHAVAPLGSTGESAYLSDAEWDEVAATSVRAVDGRVPSVVGVADLTTAGAVRRAKSAASFGADAVMLLPVSYWKLSEREIIAHFAAVADGIDIPIMAYNNPATSGIDMTPELLVRLSREIDNVTMIKESSGDIVRMQRIRQLTDGELPVFNGSNPLALQAFAAGAVGWCTAAPCLIPEQCLALYEQTRSGDLRGGRETLAAILPVLEFILQGGLPTTIKAGLIQIAAAAATGWPLAAVTAQPELLERVGITSIRRLRQCHVDLIMMGGLVTAAGAAGDPPRWAGTAVVIGAWTNPLLFLPLAVDPTLTNRKGYQAASVASFLVTSLGWAGVALSAVRRVRR